MLAFGRNSPVDCFVASDINGTRSQNTKFISLSLGLSACKKRPAGEPVGLWFSQYREGLAQLGEVFDGANHLRGVGVLVIIPRNNLNLIQIITDWVNHCLSSIE